jgi:imidazolonepropionase-like amidohydrolase
MLGSLLLILLALKPSAIISDTVLVRPEGLFDAASGRVLRGRAVLFSDQGIIRVDTVTAIPVSPGWKVIDLPAATLLPGLIDTHVHLALSGELAENSRRTLAAGFTTVRDLAGAPPSSRAQEPTVIAAVDWIGKTGGTCDFSGQGVSGPAAFANRTRDLISRGAGVIKVCLTNWWAPAVQYPDSVELSREELDSVVAPAHAAGRTVVAHAIGPAGARLAMDAGVDALAHLPRVTPAQARDLASHHMVVSVTGATILAASRDKPWRQDVFDAAKALREAGVTVVFGTDAGVLPHGQNAREAVAMQELGWSPLEVLHAATDSAAKALRLPGGAGQLVPGAPADLIAVEGNPLQDLTALQRVVLVVKAGAVFHQP